jgi:hypothetical protein
VQHPSTPLAVISVASTVRRTLITLLTLDGLRIDEALPRDVVHLTFGSATEC